jgi:putative Ca2+/H+ antiporter (TMEM165/GDT1 family)
MAWAALTAFLISFGILFIAELGDKTQLVILTLACRGCNSKQLAAGAVTGFAVIVFLGGLLAVLLAEVLDFFWISLISGIAFILIGALQIFALIRKKEEKEEAPKARSDNPFVAGFLAIVIMEMGDKTQLMTIMLAATSVSVVGTLVGAWAALSTLAIIGAFAGDWLSKKVPKEKMDWIAAILFILIGLLILFVN